MMLGEVSAKTNEGWKDSPNQFGNASGGEITP
jgi:hypothetical protein